MISSSEVKMNEDEISYQNLRKIQEKEKSFPTLSELKSDFYSELLEYLKNIDKRLEKESSSQKKTLLNEERENTKKIGINIYEHREKKIVLAAISKARGGNPDLKNMLAVEKDLFDSVFSLLSQSRGQMLNKEKQKNDINQTNNAELKEEKIPEKKEMNSNPVLLVTKSIPEFIGTDTKKYNLRKNDIISMSENMCEMLLKRNVVEKIKH